MMSSGADGNFIARLGLIQPLSVCLGMVSLIKCCTMCVLQLLGTAWVWSLVPFAEHCVQVDISPGAHSFFEKVTYRLIVRCHRFF